MANLDNPSGFTVIGTLDGGDYHGKVVDCVALAADTSGAIFVGDAVRLTGSASADGTRPQVEQAAATEAIFGYVVAVEPDFTLAEPSSSTNYRANSTLRNIQVVPADGVLVAIQEDSVGTNLAAANVGQNINITVGSGSTATGISAMELDSNTAGTASTLPFRILGVEKKQGNAIGANCRWVVTANLLDIDAATGV